jgi:hypothetical protein
MTKASEDCLNWISAARSATCPFSAAAGANPPRA